MPMKVDNQFKLKQLVYLRSDPEQYKRYVVGIYISIEEVLTYMLSCGGEQSEHFDFEISAEKELQL